MAFGESKINQKQRKKQLVNPFKKKDKIKTKLKKDT